MHNVKGRCAIGNEVSTITNEVCHHWPLLFILPDLAKNKNMQELMAKWWEKKRSRLTGLLRQSLILNEKIKDTVDPDQWHDGNEEKQKKVSTEYSSAGLVLKHFVYGLKWWQSSCWCFLHAINKGNVLKNSSARVAKKLGWQMSVSCRRLLNEIP